ncbi:hypothetical protein CW304_24320 [Bacillus sp. UFRGS-B20]|nr:hypothetical protein CW304_24320 [Bacillus sp. UFRGS-B20]
MTVLYFIANNYADRGVISTGKKICSLFRVAKEKEFVRRLHLEFVRLWKKKQWSAERFEDEA